MPHLALPTLTGFLRAQGVNVIQRDLNIEDLENVLTRSYLEQCLHKLRELYGPAANRKPQGQPAAPYEQVAWALGQGSAIAASVEQAKQTVRSAAFFDGPTGREAIQTIVQALEIASLPFYPSALEVGTYRSALPSDSSKSLLREVRDPHMNMLIEIYRNTVLDDIKHEQPDLVGISIPSMAQILPGLTLAALIKDSGLPCHITVGGPHMTMLRERLARNPSIFTLIDSVIVFDGEIPLLRLCQSLRSGVSGLRVGGAKREADAADYLPVEAGGVDEGQAHALDHIPNLIYRSHDGSIRVTERKEPEKIGSLPMPDFEGLPLDRYLAPELVLPLLSARGCYFGKCAFCNVGYGEAENVSLMQGDVLVEQMLTLRERYGVRQIFFSDEALAPRLLRDISQRMQQEETPMLWGGCARFEKPIVAPLLQQMYTGGCRMILFGLESASEQIMKRMVKGTQLEHMHRILNESTQAGIWNHTFFFFGFPGETIEDAQQTVNFLYEHKQHVHSAAFGTFLLEVDAPAHRYPKSFGISRVVEQPDRDLAIYFDYEVSEGMDNPMAERIADSFLNALPDKPYPQFYMNDVYRFLYACELSRRAQAPQPWLMPIMD